MSRWSPAVDIGRPRPPGLGAAFGQALLNAGEAYFDAYERRRDEEILRAQLVAQRDREQWVRGVNERDFKFRTQQEANDQKRFATLDAAAREEVALERALRGIQPTDALPATDWITDPATGTQRPRYTAIAGTRFSRDVTLTPEYLQAQERARLQREAEQRIAGLASYLGIPLEQARGLGTDALSTAAGNRLGRGDRLGEFEEMERIRARYRPVGEGAGGVRATLPTETERRAGAMANTVFGEFDRLDALDREGISNVDVWLAGNPLLRWLATDEGRQYHDASEAAAQNLLYVKSGAQAPEQEQERTSRVLRPSLGDDPRTRAAKAARRDQERESVRIAAGRSLPPVDTAVVRPPAPPASPAPRSALDWLRRNGYGYGRP